MESSSKFTLSDEVGNANRTQESNQQAKEQAEQPRAAAENVKKSAHSFT